MKDKAKRAKKPRTRARDGVVAECDQLDDEQEGSKGAMSGEDSDRLVRVEEGVKAVHDEVKRINGSVQATIKDVKALQVNGCAAGAWHNRIGRTALRLSLVLAVAVLVLIVSHLGPEEALQWLKP